MNEAQKLYEKRRKESGLRMLLLYHALKARGMKGMKKEITRLTKRP